MMGAALKFKREVDRGYSTYVAMPRDNLRYTIDQYYDVSEHCNKWEVNIGRDYLTNASPHLARDMRASKMYRHLREARTACQNHYEEELNWAAQS